MKNCRAEVKRVLIKTSKMFHLLSGKHNSTTIIRTQTENQKMLKLMPIALFKGLDKSIMGFRAKDKEYPRRFIKVL
jgi:hypothetical protein